MLELFPYCHPTTVCFVDDNESFLRSLRFELPDDLAYCAFVLPDEAEAFLNQPVPLAPLAQRCLSLCRDGTDRPGSALIHLDLDLIEQEIRYRERFQRVSVAVIDQAMPGLTGLELCERIRDPFIQRALLTGAADEETAVAAFNAGLIERFIPKQQDDPVSVTLAQVEALKRAYFARHSAQLLATLAMDPPGFLAEPVVAAHLQALMRQHGLVEYYLVSDPDGLLLLSQDGRPFRLVLQSAAQLAEQARTAAAHGAPRRVREALQDGRAVATFAAAEPAGYFGDERLPWDEYLVPACRLQGRQPWFAGLIEDAPVAVDYHASRASYGSYLRDLAAARP